MRFCKLCTHKDLLISFFTSINPFGIYINRFAEVYRVYQSPFLDSLYVYILSSFFKELIVIFLFAQK